MPYNLGKWKITTTQTSKDYKWPRPFKNEVWVTSPYKELWPTEVLAEGKGNAG